MTSAKLSAEVVDGHLAQLQADFVAGVANALFRAIAFCGDQQIPMPEWVVAGFFAAMNRWWGLQCKPSTKRSGCDGRKALSSAPPGRSARSRLRCGTMCGANTTRADP